MVCGGEEQRLEENKDWVSFQEGKDEGMNWGRQGISLSYYP